MTKGPIHTPCTHPLTPAPEFTPHPQARRCLGGAQPHLPTHANATIHTIPHSHRIHTVYTACAPPFAPLPTPTSLPSSTPPVTPSFTPPFPPSHPPAHPRRPHAHPRSLRRPFYTSAGATSRGCSGSSILLPLLLLFYTLLRYYITPPRSRHQSHTLTHPRSHAQPFTRATWRGFSGSSSLPPPRPLSNTHSTFGLTYDSRTPSTLFFFTPHQRPCSHPFVHAGRRDIVRLQRLLESSAAEGDAAHALALAQHARERSELGAKAAALGQQQRLEQHVNSPLQQNRRGCHDNTGTGGSGTSNNATPPTGGSRHLRSQAWRSSSGASSTTKGPHQ